MANNKKLWIVLAAVALVLLSLNVYHGFAAGAFNYWAIASNLLILTVMVFNYFNAAKAGKGNK